MAKKNSNTKRTYEIKTYATQKDYTQRNWESSETGIPTKKEAEKLARKEYQSGKFAVVKVQSSDREFIKVHPPVMKVIL